MATTAKKPAKVSMSNAKKSAQMILTVYLGLALGVFALNKIPGQYAKYLTAILGLSGPFIFSNPTVKLLMAVVGAAGTAKIVKDLTDGKTGLLSQVNSFTPTLAGMGRFAGLGMAEDVNIDRFLGEAPAQMMQAATPDSYLGYTPMDMFLN